MLNLKEFHPDLRKESTVYLSFASSSWNFFLPQNKQINWYGDVQLYCTEDLYQKLLDEGPFVQTSSIFRGEDSQRRISAEGQALDDYRLALKEWLKKFP